MAIPIPIPEFVQEYTVNLVANYVTNQLDYVWNYEKKVEELSRVVKVLQEDRDRVRDKAEEEEDRYGREMYNDVKVWLDRVDEVISEYEKFNEEHSKNGEYPLSFSNLETRHSRSKTAQDIQEKISELQREKHDSVSHCQSSSSMGFAFANVDYETFVSRNEVTRNITRALEDSRARAIGVHGSPGVGKTTLVIEVANKAREDKLFNVVIMVNVTKSPDIRKIQGQIAEMLGMKLEEESENLRANRIQRRLKKEKENTLIILDDMSVKLDLDMLGLGIASETYSDDIDYQKNLIVREERKPPVPDNVPPDKNKTKQNPKGGVAEEREKKSAGSGKVKTEVRHKGCKVLLISEMRTVLSQMGVKPSLIFSVNSLSDKEAETLFKKRAGIVDKNELGKIATEITKRCDGLPMSIVTTAKALKNQNPSVWEDTRLTLQRQRLTGTAEYSTRLSYNLLENKEQKHTFLLCASMGQDALIADLVKRCIGLGFLQDIYTVKEARDRVQSLLVKLKQTGLLSDSYSSDHFSMQNIVRNAALSIASEDNHVFRLTKGKLDEWPDEEKLEKYTDMFLQHCDFIEEFPRSIRCPRVRVFQIDNNDPHLKIPDSFFQEMKELRVLILTGIHLSPLPSSIGCLTKLRMLCLEHCKIDENSLRIIGELKNLRILSFSGSVIESLPVELKNLSKLQIFDLSNCSKLGHIPSNLISSLTRLEELYMRNTSIQWKVNNEQENQSENASLSELGNLNELTNLDLQIPSAAHLPKNLFFDRLQNYKIIVGSSERYSKQEFKMPEKYELVRFLAIQQKNGFDIHSQNEIKMLFERVENLLLEKFNGVQDLFYELNLKGFPCLKHLLVSNSDICFLINPKDRKHPEMAFAKLELLDLYKLKKLEEICSFSCELSKPSFGKLKIIKIKLCSALKNVFRISLVTFLTSLETIQVSECSSLKDIVHIENTTSESGSLEFPELRHLSLRSLVEFVGFDPVLLEEDTRILFHGKVGVTKLERLEMSSLPIDRIWNDGQSSQFENLIHLDVNNCCHLKYLLSLSVAKGLANLQNLFISECEQMKRIFKQEQRRDGSKKDNIFPKLKTIKLSSMKRLSEIWSSGVHKNSFGKLDTLIIEKCDKLVHVFPHYLAGIFRSLSSLRVTNCKFMEAIFDLAFEIKDARDVTHLQEVHLETLPKLEHVLRWRENEERIFDFNHLQKMYVQDCENLENIFPVYVAKSLENLEYLVVLDCSRLREIVARGEEEDIKKDRELELPKLTTLNFLKLPKLKSFYPGVNGLSCPLLNELSIELCDNLELFREEKVDASSGKETILFPEVVINNLKSMQIEWQHAKSSTRYRRDNLEELRLSRLEKTDVIYSFLHSNPNLKSLWLNDCSFEVLMPLERPANFESLGVVPKLTSLKLTNLIWLKEIGFEQDVILQRIEILILKNCNSLNTIAPSSVSLTYLTNLEVVDCSDLKFLMSLSTARSLVQLNIMKVIGCESLKEIVSEQGKEDRGEKDEGNASKINIVFKQLKALELVCLRNLESFCNSKGCLFEFPSLEKLVVSACPKMKSFSQEVESTPILQKIYVVHEKEKKSWCWKGSVQTTIEYMFNNKKFLEGMDKTSVDEHPYLKEVWQCDTSDLQKDWFYNLESLTLKYCEFESYAIPSNVLCCLKRLKELTVRNCDKLKAIFEMNDTGFRGTFQLKKLYLSRLPNMTHVWQKDNQGISCFQNLQEVIVHSCDKLKTLFPTTVARDLRMLELLDVSNCDELLQIVGKEDRENERMEAEEGATEKCVFPRLTQLKLQVLAQLTCFCSTMLTLGCNELHVIDVTDCNKLQLFEEDSTSITIHPTFSNIKVISEVEHLCLNSKDTKVLFSLLSQATDEVKLQYLNVLKLSFDDDVNGNSTLPLHLLGTPNLEKLEINNCITIKEIFGSQLDVPNIISNNRTLGNLKQLYLSYLFELNSIIGLEHLPKLQLLDVSECPSLTTLVLQSDSNLKELKLSSCHGLACLFTSRTARMLKRLKEMCICDCKSIKEIVGKDEHDETQQDQEMIKFERLERIRLEDLESLECFYPGNATLQLPYLIQVEILKCPKVRIFSYGQINAESFRGIRYSDNQDDDLVFHNDLNSSLEILFLHQFQGHLALGDFPELEQKWLGSQEIPRHWSFSKLKSLKVKGCEFLSDAVMPSHLLPLLENLEVLCVKKCDRVKAIFDLKDTPTRDPNMIVTLRLKKLILKQLPNLTHIWNNDPNGSLGFTLEELTVNECKSIKSLLPASVVKDNIQRLDVSSCAELVEIVTNDEAVKKEANKEVTIFSKLTSLILSDLPNLKSICSEMQIIDSSDVDGFEKSSSYVLLPSYLLPCLSKLEQLQVEKCDSVEAIFGLMNAPAHDANMIVIPLKTLILKQLPNLIHIWNNDPSGSLSFTMEEVTVTECKGIKSLFPASVAKDNIQSLEVSSCAELVEIVANNETAKKEANKEVNIFTKLTSLTLSYLPYLRSIYSEMQSMDSSDVDGFEKSSSYVLLPSYLLPCLSKLEKLQVENCDSVEAIFDVIDATMLDANMIVIPLKTLILKQLPNLSHIWNNDPNGSLSFTLEEVIVNECKSMKSLFPASVAKDNIQKLDVSSCAELVEIVANNETAKKEANKEVTIFTKLTSLTLYDLPYLKSIFSEMQIMDSSEVDGFEKSSSSVLLPSYLLHCLSKLEQLQVEKCDSVEAIFDVKDAPKLDANMIVIPLKTLTLKQLPKLSHIWNKDPNGCLSFTLEKVTVNECKRIKSLFPASVAKDNIQRLDVSSCAELVEIVVRDKSATEEASIKLALFPKLTLLLLRDLPNLDCICSGMQILDWPLLEKLNVSHCGNLKVLATNLTTSPSSYPQNQDILTIENHSILSTGTVAPHLVKLSLDKEDVVTTGKELHVDLQNIETLMLQNFHDESDVFTNDFFSKVSLPNIQKLQLIDSAFEELFQSQRPDIEQLTKILSRLKKLKLKNLYKLKSIGLEQSWVALLLENLNVLKVLECSSLTNLVPSTVQSFSGLTELHVEGCAGLKYLFTSSTAKGLVALDVISVSNCESLETVVLHEESDKPEDHVIFPELWDLSLSKLSRLASFYTGKSTLKFRWLMYVSITQCKSMETFSHGNLVAHKLEPVDIDGDQWSKVDLNTAIRQQYEKGKEATLS